MEAGAEQGREARAAGRTEKVVLVLVLLIVGCALAYAAYRASVGWPGPEPATGGDVVVLAKGDAVDLASHAVKGKYTIYDFYADWCAPCRSLDLQLRALAAGHPDVAIRKIDIVDWTSPVVAQQGIQGLPYMVLYGPDGHELASGDEVYSTVSRLFNTDLY